FAGEPKREEPVKEDETTHIDVQKITAKDYMDRFINPPDVMESRRLKAIEEKKKKARFPEKRQQDVLLFLVNYAPLRKWQRDVLTIVRDEAYYFVPQAMTKIMNEGWASYWHSTIMTQKALTDNEVLDFANLHSGTMATPPGQINPYKLGLELYRDIEERWNKGRHGREWEACDDLERRERWDTGDMAGRAKVFQVRKLYDDIGFISEFFTEDFCRRNKLFTYAFNRSTGREEIASRDFKVVKEKLLESLTNVGQPFIYVEDGNFKNRGELLLTHQDFGTELDDRMMRDTMRNLQLVWNRPVNLETRINDRKALVSYDGKEFSETK
ncbi:MAG: SpoVR family protein, partial [Planctomycetaceae bacterium]|nr:SpoVR family protein [Planctomycetaceae bacterium]